MPDAREGNPLNDYLSGKGIEQYWQRRRQKLQAKGYTLQPRPPVSADGNALSPDSTSRVLTGVANTSEDSSEHESIQSSYSIPNHPNMVVARRDADGQLVLLKRELWDGEFSHESQNTTRLLDETWRTDPKNHCVPILEKLEDELDNRYLIIVMPYMRDVDTSLFLRVQDVLDFVGQILLGLEFLHDHWIGHCDCSLHNIVVDVCPPTPPNALKAGRRILRRQTKYQSFRDITPAKYHFIDFGTSIHLEPHSWEYEFGAELPLFAYWARDTDVPEYRDSLRQRAGVWFKPFELDVFLIGNMFRREILEKYSNVEFLQRLVDAMTQENRTLRPSASEAVLEWLAILQQIPSHRQLRKLRPRMPQNKGHHATDGKLSLLRRACTPLKTFLAR